MKNKKGIKEMFTICISDRYNAFSQLTIPLKKRLNCDLILKYVVLLINSFGLRKRKGIIFVDEVNNSSMYTNLINTYNHCPGNNSIISLRKITFNNHVKCGYFFALYQFIVLFFGHICIYLISLVFGIKFIKKYSTLLLILLFQQYVDRILFNKKVMVYVMTDHNFYSSIVCNNGNVDSYVLQHGLIFGKDFYNISLADHFIAWGNRSKEILDNDTRIIVKGTYKFENLEEIISKENKVILYCVSILDFSLVSEKIKALTKIAKQTGYKLAVKIHPGSLFNSFKLDKEYKNISFYKEEKLSDINFDIAIIENSTILIDMLFLKKKFIIFDQNDGYFSRYKSIPMANNENELIKNVINIDKYDYNNIRVTIFKEELNEGKCVIFD